MSAHCHSHSTSADNASPAYRKVLISVMLLNLVMFIVELFAGIVGNSTSLLADSLDFGGDAASYAISLFVLGKHIKLRAKASLLKAVSMLGFGLWIIGTVIYQFIQGTLPKAEVMGVIGFLALVANLISVILLYRHREGDSNMLSVWLCSRNDAIGNVAVLLAAIGVYFTASNLPDLVVALAMGLLGITAAIKIMRVALHELRHHH